ILALGAEHAMDGVPGLAEHGINAWDRAETDRARAAIAGIGRGRLVIGIFGTPYACPPGPFELAMLARDRLGTGVEISLFSPAPIALPVLGQQESAKLEQLIADRGIDFHPNRKAAAVDEGSIHFSDGSELPYDVLLSVPPHRCPKVLVAAGLAEPGGWVGPDPRTLETAHDGVYAIGDCTEIKLASGLSLPKAGVFAEAQGEVVAERIGARLRGVPPEATFSGEGACFIETGGGEAAKAEGAFMADPPQVHITQPNAQAMEEKLDFERSRLHAWFGQ
ncbi:MAG: FAD-dependent oxidoreductase, partial [Chloroflexota bacterium]